MVVLPSGTGMPRPAARGSGIIQDMDGYHRLRPLLQQACPADGGFDAAYRAGQVDGSTILFLNLEGFFWWPRRLLGIERHLYAFSDQPELLHEINRDQAAWMLRAIDALRTVPDLVMLGEDLSYNHGPMLSRRSFDEFLAPYYRQAVPALRARGIRVFIDSDGDITRCLDWFAGVGIEGVLPLERQAGVDIEELQRRQPGMLFLGHFDKMTMPLGEAAMRAEFERLLPAMRRGRFIPSVDHQTPPGVSLQQYRCFARLFAEYARLAATMQSAGSAA